MNVLLTFLICLVVVLIVILIVSGFLIPYQVDRDANKNSTKITYKEFKTKFEQIEWIQDYTFSSSLTDEKTKSNIFCSEFKINGTKYFFTNYFEWKKWKIYFNNIIKWSIVNIKRDISIDEKIKSYDYKYKTQCETRQRIETRLCNALKSLCSQLDINISYHDMLGDAAGRILYNSNNGRYILDGSRIEILNKYKDEPWVLAHELGHYMAIKQRSDTTEEGADREALMLCNSILTEQEHEEIEFSLSIYFEHKIKS